MNTRIQTMQIFEDGRCAIGFDLLDANNQPVKTGQQQDDMPPELLAANVAWAAERVAEKLGDVTDATRAGSLVNDLKRLDDARAAFVEADNATAAKIAAIVQLDAAIASKQAEFEKIGKET